MSLETWNELQKDSRFHKVENMKTKQVKILINIGTNDAERLHLGHERLFVEGDVVSLDEPIADKLIAEKLAKEYDAAAQKEDAALAERRREAAIQAVMPEAEREVALEEAKQEAAKRLKAKPAAATHPATPSSISSNPHDPVKKTS